MKRRVTPRQFAEFIAAYPSPLEKDVKHFCEPPCLCYHDFTIGNAFESIVASEVLNDEGPNDFFIFDSAPGPL